MQLKLETGVAFAQPMDSLDQAETGPKLPVAMSMMIRFLEEAVLDRYNLSVACWGGQNAEGDLFCIRLLEESGKMPDVDIDLNRLWCDLAEAANHLQSRTGGESVINFNSFHDRVGAIITSSPKYCLDLFSVISDTNEWNWRDPKLCHDRGYTYSLQDVLETLSRSTPDIAKKASVPCLQ